MRQVPRSPLSFKLQRVANVPEHPPPSTRLMSCAHIANRRLSRIIGARSDCARPDFDQRHGAPTWNQTLAAAASGNLPDRPLGIDPLLSAVQAYRIDANIR